MRFVDRRAVPDRNRVGNVDCRNLACLSFLTLTHVQRPVDIQRLCHTLTDDDMVMTTLRTLSNCSATLPVRITPNSIRDRRLETVMFALPMYPLDPRSTLTALK